MIEEPAEEILEELDGSGRGSKAKLILPWAFAAVVIAYLLWYVPLDEVAAAISEAEVGWFLPLIMGSVVYWFLLDSLAYSYLISRFNAPLSWQEARGMRGVTYWVAALNWNAGTAAIILYLHRLKQVRPLESTSSVMFYTMFDAVILAGFAFVGALFLPSGTLMTTVLAVSASFIAGSALFFWLVVSDRPSWLWLKGVRAWSVFSSHRKAQPRDFLVLLVIRSSYLTGFVACFLFGASTFEISVPIGLGLASVPVIMMMGAVPISPAGLGTQAAAMLFFWSDAGEAASIVAYGLVFPVALTLARVILGTPYMREFKMLTSGKR